MALDPSPRTVLRAQQLLEKELHKREKVVAALPVWLGGAYVPFLGSIVVAVALAAGLASALGASGLVVAALGAAVGAIAGRWVAMRAVSDHPVDAQALQVILAATDTRVMVYEPKSWGKPGRLLDAFPVSRVADVHFTKGGLLRPSRLEFLAPDGHHRYEFSGLWNIDSTLEALGG
jgi:hypothetical protein